MKIARAMKRIGCGALLAAVLLLCAGIWLMRATVFAPRDVVPSALPPLPDAFQLSLLKIPAQGDLPALDVEDAVRSGRGMILLCCDPNSFTDPAALRWVSALGECIDSPVDRPWNAGVVGIVSSPAMPEWLRKPPIALMAKSRGEFPMRFYLDFGRALGNALELPKGRVAVVLVSPSREVVRIVSEPGESEISLVTKLLGAPSEASLATPPGPDLASLLGSDAAPPLAICFLAKEASAKDVPLLSGSPLTLLLSGFAPPDDPDLRVLSFFAHAKDLANGRKPTIVIAGTVEGFVDKPWRRVVDDASLRAAFGIPPRESAFVLVDREGRQRMRVKGLVPMWRLGLAADLLGFPLSF